MRLLLDTHIALWSALTPAALSAAERSALERADGPLVVSSVSIWELRLKWHSLHVSGERKGPVGPADIVRFGQAMAWQFLPLLPHHAATDLRQKLDHKDPFDELLLVQAQEEGLHLLTRDAKLADHPLVVAG